MQATDHKEYEAQGFHNLDEVQGFHKLASKQLSPLIRQITKAMWACAMGATTLTQALCASADLCNTSVGKCIYVRQIFVLVYIFVATIKKRRMLDHTRAKAGGVEAVLRRQTA